MSAETAELQAIHKTLIGFNKRAERATEETLVATFVDSAPLFDLLSTTNNQVIYGRRGTGKTHALKYLAERIEQSDDYPIYLDLRSVGSNGSIYSDSTQSVSVRTSQLLVDVLSGLTNEIYSLALGKISDHPNPGDVTRRLDALEEAVSTIRVSGQTEVETADRDRKADNVGLDANFSLKDALVGFGLKAESRAESERSRTVRRSGHEAPHLVFGNISGAIVDVLSVLNTSRIWLLIDEWSEIPIDLQPYLADLIRRTLLPINIVTIKIAAIEHRSNFAILKDRGEYIGLELGSDISADLNLDDFLVFDNSQEKATHFIKALIFKHYAGSDDVSQEFDNADALIQATFTQYPAFEEFVRAVEGVPRDALNLIAKVATKGFGQKISMNHVRSAARDWYTQDKAAAIRSDFGLGAVLTHIVDDVIGNRRARAFLFPSNTKNESIEKLFDARLLHILKKNVSSHDQPGARFDVYKIDFGCYVDLINTAKAPEGLFESEEDGYVEVPKDDYRSIRRAILNPTELSAAQNAAVAALA